MRWLTNWLRPARRPRPVRPRRRPLEFERLEDRTVPSLVAVGVGPGQAPVVKAYDSQTGARVLSRTAPADVTGDGKAARITGACLGGGPDTKVIVGTLGTPVYSLFAFNMNFTGGVFVAAGDLAADGTADLVGGAGPNGGSNLETYR